MIRKDAAGNPRREGGDNRDIKEGGSAADRSTVGAGRGHGTGDDVNDGNDAQSETKQHDVQGQQGRDNIWDRGRDGRGGNIGVSGHRGSTTSRRGRQREGDGVN